MRLPTQGHSPAGPAIHVSAAQDVDLDRVAVPVALAELVLAALVLAVGLRIGNVVGLHHDARHGAQVVVVVGLVAAAAEVRGRLPRPGQVGSFDVPLHLGRKPGRCVPQTVVRRRVHNQEDATHVLHPAVLHRVAGRERRRAAEPIQHDGCAVAVLPSHTCNRCCIIARARARTCTARSEGAVDHGRVTVRDTVAPPRVVPASAAAFLAHHPGETVRAATLTSASAAVGIKDPFVARVFTVAGLSPLTAL